MDAYIGVVKVKKAKIRNQYNQVPHLTWDTIWESNKNTRKHHTQESQEVSPSPVGDHKAAGKRQDNILSKTNMKQISKKDPQKHHLGTLITQSVALFIL